MGMLPRHSQQQSAVTKQPCHVELAKLLDMVNPDTNDWPPSPRTDDYHPELQSRDTSFLGVFQATLSRTLGNCLGQRQRSQAVREMWHRVMNLCVSSKTPKSEKPSREPMLWPGVQSLQSFFGGGGGGDDKRKVRFNGVPQVRLIEGVRQLYPATLEGEKIKREAFWTSWEIEVNQVRWYAHIDPGKYADCGLRCDCLGCQLDGEIHDVNLVDMKTSTPGHASVRTLQHERVPSTTAVSELSL